MEDDELLGPDLLYLPRVVLERQSVKINTGREPGDGKRRCLRTARFLVGHLGRQFGLFIPNLEVHVSRSGHIVGKGRLAASSRGWIDEALSLRGRARAGKRGCWSWGYRRRKRCGTQAEF